MKIKTKFNVGDTIVYLEKSERCSSEKVINQGRIGKILIEVPDEYECHVQITYVLYNRNVVNEVYCYSSLDELKDTLLKTNEYRIKNLSLNSTLRG